MVTMEDPAGFFTQKGYQIRNPKEITAAMEDYLEMICRQAGPDGFARINLLAHRLNVRPSSASKMVYHLRDQGLVAFEKYGLIRPTDKGRQLGDYLLRRHDLLHRFFCVLNGAQEQLELTEQIEHYIDEGTLENLAKLLEKMEHSPDLLK